MLKVFPYRIVPCDFGNEISDSIYNNILVKIEKLKNWELISRDINNPKEAIKIKHKNFNLHLSFYGDGIGIFTFIDSSLVFENITDFDEEKIILERRSFHKGILSHSHKLSVSLNEIIDSVRPAFGNKLRHTARKEWENKGLSYVMSYYYIAGNVECVDDAVFQDKMIALLFPLYNEKMEYDFRTLNISKEAIAKRYRENFYEVAKHDYEVLPHVYTCASWSNFLIIGNLSDRIIEEYWNLEKDLQHVWYFTYVTDKFIELSLRNISSRTPEKELEQLFNILTEMMYKINQYEGIVSSTLQERDFKLYEALRKSSRLDVLIESVEKKANLLKDRYNWVIEEKRIGADKKIQLILFIIAVLSLVSSFEAFTKLGWKTTIILACSLIIVGLLLFKPFTNQFRNKKK